MPLRILYEAFRLLWWFHWLAEVHNSGSPGLCACPFVYHEFGEHWEDLINVCALFGWGLHEGETQFLTQLLAFLWSNCSCALQVRLVSNYYLCYIACHIPIYFVYPICNILKGFPVAHVIYKQYTIGASVVATGHSSSIPKKSSNQASFLHLERKGGGWIIPKLFLSSCISYQEGHLLSFIFHNFASVIIIDCLSCNLWECVVQKSDQTNSTVRKEGRNSEAERFIHA